MSFTWFIYQPPKSHKLSKLYEAPLHCAIIVSSLPGFEDKAVV